MIRALQLATYPVVMTAAVAGAAIMLAHGHAPILVLVTIPPLAAAIIIALEWVIPFRRAWNRNHHDLATDCIHLVLSARAVESLPLVVNGALVAAASSLAATLGRAPWPTTAPLALQVALALAVSELFHYGIHRALHTFDPLWKLHAVHHSATRMYWLNASRVHPIESFFYIATGATVLVVGGVPTTVLTIHSVYLVVAGLFQHANLDLRHGPLNWLLSTSEVHRYHHSTDRREVDANYGAALLIWDWVFRTHRTTPTGSAPDHIGGPVLPTDWWGQIRWPFRRARP